MLRHIGCKSSTKTPSTSTKLQGCRERKTPQKFASQLSHKCSPDCYPSSRPFIRVRLHSIFFFFWISFPQGNHIKSTVLPSVGGSGIENEIPEKMRNAVLSVHSSSQPLTPEVI